MQFPKYLHAKGWHAHMPHLHMVIAAAVIAAGALLGSAMHRAGETRETWQAQLSHGLLVSLRAVADGNDRPVPQRRETGFVAEVATTRGLQPAITASGR